MFALLYKASSKVNLEKSTFFRTEVNILGHIVTGEDILSEPQKIYAIKKVPVPAHHKELKGFLGLASYHRRFIKDFMKIVKPLTNLSKGENAQIKASQSQRIQTSLII